MALHYQSCDVSSSFQLACGSLQRVRLNSSITISGVQNLFGIAIDNLASFETSRSVILAFESIAQPSNQWIAVAEAYDLHIKVKPTVQFRHPTDTVRDPHLFVTKRSTAEQC